MRGVGLSKLSANSLLDSYIIDVWVVGGCSIARLYYVWIDARKAVGGVIGERILCR